jgi:hypothetical protein
MGGTVVVSRREEHPEFTAFAVGSALSIACFLIIRFN